MAQTDSNYDGQVIVTATGREIAAAFEQWLRDYEADPDSFTEYGEPKSYGESCAAHLIERLAS